MIFFSSSSIFVTAIGMRIFNECALYHYDIPCITESSNKLQSNKLQVSQSFPLNYNCVYFLCRHFCVDLFAFICRTNKKKSREKKTNCKYKSQLWCGNASSWPHNWLHYMLYYKINTYICADWAKKIEYTWMEWQGRNSHTHTKSECEQKWPHEYRRAPEIGIAFSFLFSFIHLIHIVYSSISVRIRFFLQLHQTKSLNWHKIAWIWNAAVCNYLKWKMGSHFASRAIRIRGVGMRKRKEWREQCLPATVTQK